MNVHSRRINSAVPKWKLEELNHKKDALRVENDELLKDIAAAEKDIKRKRLYTMARIFSMLRRRRSATP